MGVPQAMSNQGIVSRYVEQLADRGQGRLTVRANADESYRGILELADRVDRGALVDLASVFRRGESKPRYTNTPDSSGNWVSPPGLRQALQTERERPWTAAESDGFVATQLRLREAGRGLGGEWPARLAAIEKQAQPLLTPAAGARLGPVRPSAAAARSRSTTKPVPGAPAPGTDRSGPRHGTDGPEQRRGRSRYFRAGVWLGLVTPLLPSGVTSPFRVAAHQSRS
jgi:hypothetical protein